MIERSSFLLSSSLKGELFTWRIQASKIQLIHQFIIPTTEFVYMHLAPNSKTFMALDRANNQIGKFEIRPTEVLDIFKGYFGHPGHSCLTFTANQKIVYGIDRLNRNGLKVQWVNKGNEVKIYSFHDEYLNSLKLIEDKKILLTCSNDRTICMFQSQKIFLLKRIETDFVGHINSMEWFQNNIYACDSKGGIKMFDLKYRHLKEMRTVTQNGAMLMYICPDSKMMFLGGQNCKVWVQRLSVQDSDFFVFRKHQGHGNRREYEEHEYYGGQRRPVHNDYHVETNRDNLRNQQRKRPQGTVDHDSGRNVPESNDSKTQRGSGTNVIGQGTKMTAKHTDFDLKSQIKQREISENGSNNLTNKDSTKRSEGDFVIVEQSEEANGNWMRELTKDMRNQGNQKDLISELDPRRSENTDNIHTGRNMNTRGARQRESAEVISIAQNSSELHVNKDQAAWALENTTLLSKLSDLEVRLVQAIQAKSFAQDSLKQFIGESDKKDKTISEMRAKCRTADDLEQQVTKLSVKNVGLEKELKSKDMDVVDLQQEIISMSRQMEQQSLDLAKMGALEAKLDKFRKKLDQKVSRIEELEDETEWLDAKRKKWKNRCKSKKKDRTS